MSHNNRNKRRGTQAKLNDFPEDFDDTYFYFQVVESSRSIPILRNIVYRKIKDSIQSRIDSYKDTPLALYDKISVSFDLAGFTEFDWAVIREELMYQGFQVESRFDSDNKFTGLVVHVVRDISLTLSLREMRRRDEGESDSDEERSDDEEEYDDEECSCECGDSCKCGDGCGDGCDCDESVTDSQPSQQEPATQVNESTSSQPPEN